uniref:Phage protein n=1 Tax=Ascaris lumbricoides TaxID=6252 RepID=A0A0M3I0K1_ASCLU
MELFESDDETIQEFAHKIGEIFDMTCETMQTDDKHTLINIKWKGEGINRRFKSKRSVAAAIKRALASKLIFDRAM